MSDRAVKFRLRIASHEGRTVTRIVSLKELCQAHPSIGGDYAAILTKDQFTGLKVSGQELYDGDLFRIKDDGNPEYFDKYLFECYWNYTKWDARIVQGPDGGYDSDYTDRWLPNTDGDDETHVIVGNIYESKKEPV